MWGGGVGNKVKTFRQVIEVHRLELNQKQQYWDEALVLSWHSWGLEKWGCGWGRRLVEQEVRVGAGGRVTK